MKQQTDDILAQLLDECYERLEAGESLAACLQRYPEHASNLTPLLETIAGVVTLRPVPARDAAVVERSRAQFMAAVRQMSRKRTPQPGLWERLSGGWAEFLRGLAGPRPMPVGLVIALVLVILIGVAGTGAVAASATTLPGDLLYPVKTAAQEARVLLARDPDIRTILVEQFAEERRQDTQEIVKLQRVIRSLPLAGVIEAIDAGRWQVSGLTLIIDPQTTVVGIPLVGARVQGTLRAPGDGTLHVVRIEVAAPEPITAIPATALPTASATALPPTATAVATATAKPTSAPVDRSLPPLDIPTDPPVPTATPTATATATATATPTPTSTNTMTPAPTPTWAREEVKARIQGTVTSINGSRWTVEGVSFDTDAQTQYIGAPDIGWKVEVVLVMRADGSYVARTIRAISGPEAPPEPFDFTGRVEAIDGDRWTIEGQVVKVLGNTIIEGDPRVGSWVTVHAERRASGEVWALRIKELVLGERDFQGVIESMSGSDWRIAGQSVRVTAETTIIGEPRVGREAQVRVVVQPDGVLLATIIYVLPETPTPTVTPPHTPTATVAPPASNTPTPTITSAEVATATPTATKPPTPTATPTPTPSVEAPEPSPSATVTTLAETAAPVYHLSPRAVTISEKATIH